jgi:DNA-binding response OmpR family regulator
MKRILLVEDEPDLINILDVVLSEEGYQVTQMHSAEEAMQYCPDSTPDLIISDTKMGTMDGLTMLEQMRKVSNLKNIPFVFISATSDVASINKAKELGAVAYFAKPFDIDEVVSTVKAIVV